MKRIAVTGLLALVVAGCVPPPATRDEPTSTSETAVAPESASPAAPDVSEAAFWDNIPIGDGETLRIYVEELNAEGDCSGLQEVFDTWYQADHVVDFTSPLLDHLDTVMREAGCYSD